VKSSACTYPEYDPDRRRARTSPELFRNCLAVGSAMFFRPSIAFGLIVGFAVGGLLF
jgi:hypothetical protein